MKKFFGIMAMLLIVAICAVADGSPEMSAYRTDTDGNFGLMVYVGDNTGAISVTADGEPVGITSETYADGTSWIYLVDIRNISTKSGDAPVTTVLKKLIEGQREGDNYALFYNGKASEIVFLDSGSLNENSINNSIKVNELKLNKEAPSLDDTLGDVLQGLNGNENVKKHVCLVLLTGHEKDEAGIGCTLDAETLQAFADRHISVYTIVLKNKDDQDADQDQDGYPDYAQGACALADGSFAGQSFICYWAASYTNENNKRASAVVDQILEDSKADRLCVVHAEVPALSLAGKTIVVSVGTATCEIAAEVTAAEVTEAEDTAEGTAEDTAEGTAAEDTTAEDTTAEVSAETDTDTSVSVNWLYIGGGAAIVLIAVVLFLLIRKRKRDDRWTDGPDRADGPDGEDGPDGTKGPARGERIGSVQPPEVEVILRPIGARTAGTIGISLSGSRLNGVMLGRDSAHCHVVITDSDKKVSGQHAAIAWKNGQLLLKDAGSTNGTFVNGARVTQVIALKQQDEVSFGPETKFIISWNTKNI